MQFPIVAASWFIYLSVFPQLVFSLPTFANATMGVYTQLPKDLEEVDVIVAGGKYTKARVGLPYVIADGIWLTHGRRYRWVHCCCQTQ